VRVLLVRAGALGDLLLLRRAIAALRTAGHEPWLIAPEAGRALVGPAGSELTDFVSWDSPGIAALLAGTLPVADPLADRFALTDVALAYTRSPETLAALGRACPRVIARDPTPATGHASVWLAEPVRSLGADPDPMPPDLLPTAAEQEAARPWLDRLPRGFLAMHPGSGSPAKNWPAERFAALADRHSPAEPWLLIEGPADRDAAAPLRAHPRAVRPTALPARVLGTVLAGSGLFVGNDSGISHLAAAFGAPVLALFGPTDPAVWSPVGRRVKTLRSSDETMAGLSVDVVMASANGFLSDR
jgi:heptosyltransferase III